MGKDSFYEMCNRLVYSKMKDRVLFYVPECNIKCHDEMGHIGINKTNEIFLRTYCVSKKKKVKKYIDKRIIYSPSSGKVDHTIRYLTY